MSLIIVEFPKTTVVNPPVTQDELAAAVQDLLNFVDAHEIPCGGTVAYARAKAGKWLKEIKEPQ